MSWATPSSEPRLPRLPALDGIRALALLAVLLFHSGFRWARGGFLGVTIFFVLSGYLITTLLLVEHDSDGGIALREFWLRRLRRLGPALVVLGALVVMLVRTSAIKVGQGVVGDWAASAAWMSNWRLVAAHRSYAALFSGPSPFQHLWSLAIEEQVYLLLPLVALATLGLHSGRQKRLRLGITVAGLAAASTAASALLHHPGHPILHEYYGTDARAAEPLTGALLAIILTRHGSPLRLSGRVRAVVTTCAVVAFPILVLTIARTADTSDWLYRGGFLAVALASAAVVAEATRTDGLAARILGAAPLAAVGRISYGAYLFHWPLFLWLSPHRTGLAPAPLLALRASATFGLASTSYWLVENPVRRAVSEWRVALAGWADAGIGVVAALAIATHAGSVVPVGVAASSPLRPPPVPASPPAAGQPGAPPTPAGPSASSSTSLVTSVAAAQPVGGPQNQPTHPPPSTSTTLAQPPAGDTALRVAVVGDSMADGLATGLDAWARQRGSVVVYNLSIHACPMSRGGTRRDSSGDDFPIESSCGWWSDPSSDRSEYLATFRPDVVVVQDGLNELPDRKLPSWTTYRHPGEPLFDQWLLGEYSTLVDTIGRGGAKVVMLNAVCAGWGSMGPVFDGYDGGEGDRRVSALNTTAQALAADGATVADFFGHLCPNGSFDPTVDGVPNGRPDGYHLSEAAAEAVARVWLGPLVLQTAGRPGA